MSRNADGTPTVALQRGLREGMKWCLGFDNPSSGCSNPEPHRAHNPYPRGTAQHDDWEHGAMVAANAEMQGGDALFYEERLRSPAQWVESTSNDIGS